MESKAAKRYLSQVKQRLICPMTDRACLVERAKSMIFGFAEESPEAAYEDYVANFGVPQDFAGTVLDGVDQQWLCAVQRRRKWLCLGLAAVLATALIGSAIFWCFQYFQVRELTKNGDITVIIYPAEEITEEEFWEEYNNSLQGNSN